jgi:regulatory protein
VSAGTRKITDIRRGSGPHRRRVTLYLDDETWRTTTISVARALGLAVGDDIVPASVDTDARELETAEARERALRLLGYRERSVADLHRKLTDDGYPIDIVESLVADFVRSGLVDDERFADLLARSLVQLRGFGLARARGEFERHGVDEAVASGALARVAPADEEPGRALEAARRSLRPSDTIDRMAARLVRRGFSPSVAFSTARSVIAEASDDTVEFP